jgi:parvulin-like peptidyl-prolyl isomerase
MTKRSSAGPTLTRKQLSRAAREARIQRLVLIGIGVVAAAVVGVIGYALVEQFVLIPQRAVATVNGEPVTVGDFRKRVKLVSYYSAQPETGQPVDSLSLGQQVLDTMITERLVWQLADERGVSVSDEEVEAMIRRSFGYPSPEEEAEAGDEATATPTLTPSVTPTFVYTRTPTTTPTPEPGVTPTATPSGPTPKPPTPQPTPTIDIEAAEEAYQTAYDGFIKEATDASGLTEQEIRDQFAYSALVDKLIPLLDLDVPKTELRVHAAHILVDDEGVARRLLKRIEAGESFEELAAEYSKDSANAYRGGDLGWFGPGSMVPEFELAAFALQPGEVSPAPVQTEFGWHLIKVYDRQEVALSEYRLEQERTDAFSKYLDTLRAEADVVIDENWALYLPPLEEQP